MAINLKLPELKKGKSRSKGKMPTKNYINILAVKKQTFNWKKNLPLLILIGILFIVFCKFALIDRLTASAREAQRLESLQTQLTETNNQIAAMSDLDDLYAHYTFEGMTAEELNRVDRVHAMRLIDDAFLDGNISRSWNLTGNVMTLQVSGPSLSELNQLASELEQNAIVERCVISSADKGLNENGDVAVTFIIYLQQPWAE